MTPDQLKKWREIREKGFKGPWHTEVANPVTFVCSPGGKIAYSAFDFHDNAVLAATAVNAFIPLIDEVERLREENERLKEDLEIESSKWS
tara:strand:+ start:1848 stop:2117 length:270 start_codon:yes stop_codon:yes gene_type:complete